MLLTAPEAYSAVNCFNGVVMTRGGSYKDHLIANWDHYLRNSGRSLNPHIQAMSEQEAANLVTKIHLFWSQTPFGDLIGERPVIIEDTEKRCIEVGLIKEDSKNGA